MEEIFRFLQIRPAQYITIEKDTILATPSVALHEQLTSEPTKTQAALKQIASSYLNSRRALHSVDDLELGVALVGFMQKLKSVEELSPEHLSADIEKYFNMGADDLINQPSIRNDRERLSDVLILNTILSRDSDVSSDQAAQLLRVIDIITRHVKHDASLASRTGISSALERIIVLPADLFPLNRAVNGGYASSSSAESGSETRRRSLQTERDRLISAYRMLTRVNPSQIVTNVPQGSVTNERAVPSLLPLTHTNEAGNNTNQEVIPTSNVAVRNGGSLNVMLKPSVFAVMNEPERTVLTNRGIDPTKVVLAAVANRLSIELEDIEKELAGLEWDKHDTMLLMGSKYVPSSAFDTQHLQLEPSPIPTGHGTATHIGIGDLLVVRQSLKGYEARELAHVENILKGEYKDRTHRRARTTEETLTTQMEAKREEERDQQTTERFELKTETSRIQKEDDSLKMGASLSGKYGPTVEFKAYTDYALSTSKEEAVRIATNYSKDITNRAVSRIFERRSEERILKTIEVFEEKNVHILDNKTGSAHVIGQYQWIDKNYEAQVFNYGKRMLFDIMLPEPAAFLLHAFAKAKVAGTDFVKPRPFSISPSEITEWNYGFYVKEYEVAGITSPPQPYIYVSKAVEGKGKSDEGATKLLEIPLGDGYEAIGYEWKAMYNTWEGASFDGVLLPEPTGSVAGTITLAIKTHKIEAFTYSVSILCQQTPRALNEWRLKTHTAILQAYQKQLRDYEAKLAALEIQAAQQMQGHNPLDNELLIRNELKKGAISILTNQHYGLFGSIATDIHGYPQPNLSEAEEEGKYIRFFEQAFEWEQMTYFLYPYFWGRKANWINKMTLQDVDPRFAEFIRAGSSRAVIAVRPGFERAIAHFLTTGEIWEGGDLPDITSPLYVSIIDEIRERDKASGLEVAQGEPWNVRLPTTLVILRDQAKLPTWRKNDRGEWVPS